MGPSGCGKSTLLNIIGGLLAGDSGMVKLNEFTYGTRQPSGNVKIRRHGVGWIFQDFHLVDHLTALDNVALALGLSGLSDTEANIRALKALERVGLGDRLDHIPDQLSGGQRQRVAIARAVAGRRPLLLADEPTGNLDSRSGEEILQLFHDLCHDSEDPISILMVTHDPNLASRRTGCYCCVKVRLLPPISALLGATLLPMAWRRSEYDFQDTQPANH